MDLCRTRMPILMTVPNVHFKIKMNSEKPGPAVPNIPIRDARPAPPRPRGKWLPLLALSPKIFKTALPRPAQCLRIGVQEDIFVFNHIQAFGKLKNLQLG